MVMGLNVNYNLLIEGNNSPYHIPEYKQYYTPLVPTNEVMMQAVSDFNQEIRECEQFLSNLYETESLNEATAAVNIVNGIKSVIARVKKAITTLLGKILAAIKKIIDAVERKAASMKDSIESKYRYHERVTMLKKALADTEAQDKVINIGDIKPTGELLDKSFPDVSVIGSPLVKMATDTMHDYMLNIMQKSSLDGSALGDTEVKSSESFVDYMESEKEGLLSKIFGKYEYDPTSIVKSANDAATAAFGSSERKDVELTVDLYGQACDNMDRASDIVRDMSKFHDDLVKGYNAISRELDEIAKSTDYLDKAYVGTSGLGRERYYNASKIIITRINRTINVIQEVVNAAFTLANHKAARTYQIFGSAGDSARVKNACHKLIHRHKGIETADTVKENNFDVINGREAVDEFYQIQDMFNSSLILANEAFLEESYTERVVQAICEAEGDQQQQTQTTTTQTTTTTQQPTEGQGGEQKTNIIKKTGQAILEWLTNIIGKLGQAWQRFKNRVEELIIKNIDAKTFWEKNKDKIQNLQFTDTTVNDWHNYNIEAFGKSTIVPFDVASEDLKSDEALQNVIMKKITTTLPQFDEKDTFTQKINKIYQGEYIKDDNNAKLLNNTKFDATAVFVFMDDISTKGFASDALAKSGEDYKAIDNAYKSIKGSYETYLAKMKPAEAQQAAANADNQKSEPQNAAAIEEDDFRFNLAECFGLNVYHEAEINVGQNDRAANGTATEGNDTSNKELDAMIKRWFTLNTVAITAKLTAALAAYKQYLSLYKASLGAKPAPKKEEENKTEGQKPAENNNQ